MGFIFADMSVPLFYHPNLTDALVELDEETSRHINVLRMQQHDLVQLTDGNGKTATASISGLHKKKTVVQIGEVLQHPQRSRKVCIAISLVKNSSRFEWFLEKATELGVSEIIPLICSRTEKEKLRFDRMQNIVVSAMLQSQQSWLPQLSIPQNLKDVLQSSYEQKLIAHCLPGEKRSLTTRDVGESTILLIGPEGDFTPEEITQAIESGYEPVSLGNTRLRTETAGIAGAVLLTSAGSPQS